jgi:D-alanine-D-alanine ligase
MGGTSSEHDVSMQSGFNMLTSLDTSKFSPFPVLISKANTWLWPGRPAGFGISTVTLNNLKQKFRHPGDWQSAKFPIFKSFPKCGIMLLGLHGQGGEDGRIQGFLDLAGQPYTGSRLLGSALSMDKIKSKDIYRQHGIPTPKSLVVSSISQSQAVTLERELGYPMVLKNPTGGSSLEVLIAKNRSQLNKYARLLFANAPLLLVEAFVKGRETTCGFLEGFKPLPPTEIKPLQDTFFNYEAKYQAGRTQEITPAPFGPVFIKKMQTLAQKCHYALNLSVYSRTDFIIKNGALQVLETNSLPGFTSTSILPQQASHAGLNYKQLLSHIITRSLAK